MAGFDRLHFVDEHVVDLRIVRNEVVIRLEPVFRCAFIHLFHVLRVNAFEMLVIGFSRLRVHRRIAAA
ncbi:hypothetical protein D3C73_1639800 [compost metagenome]